MLLLRGWKTRLWTQVSWLPLLALPARGLRQHLSSHPPLTCHVGTSTAPPVIINEATYIKLKVEAQMSTPMCFTVQSSLQRR